MEKLRTLLSVMVLLIAMTAWGDDVTWDVVSEYGYSYSGTHNVTLANRTFTANTWEGLCLPFSVSEEQLQQVFGTSVNLQEFDSYENNVISFRKATSVVAGKPYYIKISTTVSDPVFSGVTFGSSLSGWQDVAVDENISFRGFYYKIYEYQLVGGQARPVSAYWLENNQYKEYNNGLTYSNDGRIGTQVFLFVKDYTGLTAPTISFEGNTSGDTEGGGTDEDTDEGEGGGNEGGGNIDPTSLTYKIAHKQQLTNLPTVYVTIPDVTDLKTQLTKNRTTGEALYHSATMTIVDDGNDGTNIQLENLVDEPFDIKVRGNSTAEPEKRPYRIKFPKGHKHDLIGNGYTKRNWTLLANCFDHSLIRNAVTYELGKEIGMPFNAGYKFVDLVINGDYRGTYQISDHVEVGSNRIDIDETTGWYVEFQGRADMLDEPYVNPGSVPMFSIKNPDYTDPGEEAQLKTLKSEMTDWIKEYVTGWSYDPAVFASPTTGWRAYNDEAQLVKFVLETEITADWDGYMTVKAYRDPNGGKLFWGPVWDKDLAYGNYGNIEEILACSVNASTLKYYVYNADGTNNLFHDAKFIKKLKTAYDNLIAGGIEDKLTNKITELTNLLSQSEKLNFEKWTYTETHNGLQKYHSYTNHADYTAQVKTFLTNRLSWFGTYLAGVYNDLGCADLPDEPTGDDDNTFEPTTTINYDVATGGRTIPATSFSDKATKIEVTFTVANDVDFWGFYGFNGSQWNANNFNSVTKTKTIVIDNPESIALIAQNGITFELQSNDTMGALIVLVENTMPEETEDPDAPVVRQQLTNLPTIYLDAEEVDGSWRGAAMEVFDGENKLGQGTTWTKTTADVSVQYQGSGNKNKDSYRLKFESKIKLIGANKYKQWVLLANDDDPSMINNALAKELGDAVGMPWTPGYQFVDLYVNNEYMGTYQVTDRVKAEDGRSLVSGGNKDADWQVRLNDATELEEDGTTDYITATNGVNVIYKNPDPKDLTAEQLSALQSDMKKYFDNVFTKTDGTYPNFAENVDKQQLINWYICQEILGVYKGFSSIEAYRSITATAADNLLHFGPLWDSEKAFGNLGEAPAMSMADKETANSYLGLMTNYAAYGEMKALFTYLWTQPWFGSGVRDKWNTLKDGGLLATLKTKADAISGTLSESQPKNAEKWAESLGGAKNYSATITNIKNYLTTRFDYLDTKFNARAASLCEHTFTYVDNGDGTHKHYCTKCEYTDVESEAHTLTMVSGKAKCSVCELDVTAEVTGTEGEKVYILDAGKSSARYITKTGGFTPDANKLYAINEQPEEGVEFDNVYWTINGVNYADNIVVTDGTPWAGTVKVYTKKASYSRTMSATSKWGTVCIPFRAGSNNDITFYKISGCSVTSDGIGTISFEKDDYTGGLNPAVYMKNDNAAMSVTFTSKAKDGEDYVTFKKPSEMSDNTTTSSNFTFYGNVLESQTVNTTADANPALYGISNNKFVHATRSLTVAPFRAYFSYDAGTGTAAKSFAPIVSLDSEETSVAGVMSERNALAIFCNGGGSVTLIAPCDMTITITDLSGKYIKAIPATANERYDILLPVGINIINSLKVTVR